ncbi:MAG: porin [Cohaesibacter sp.]|jgi:hypothetical protein|nr:porin [Cohaesibacter sp.]
MNIKSLILGSAAALVAAGSAQAADLPVAEPVEYVKVCNAYGAGYHFIPGTDTCLKINGYVRADVNYVETKNERVSGTAANKVAIAARVNLNFTAKSETELGTLVGFARYDTANGAFDKYYLSLGGLYAGVADAAADIDYTKGMYLVNAYFSGHDVGAVGYNMDLGNGVSAKIAIENQARTGTAALVGGATGGYAGQVMPDVAASLSVNQGWGKAKVGGVVSQIRYLNQGVTAFDTDYGYAIGAGLQLNLDMLSAGSNIAFAGGYSAGALRYLTGLQTGAAGLTDATVNAAGNMKLNTGFVLYTALNYAWTDTVSTQLEGGYTSYNDKSAANEDAKAWGTGLTVTYKPVTNFTVRAGVAYNKVDYSASAASATRDQDQWSARLRLQRDF